MDDKRSGISVVVCVETSDNLLRNALVLEGDPAFLDSLFNKWTFLLSPACKLKNEHCKPSMEINGTCIATTVTLPDWVSPLLFYHK